MLHLLALNLYKRPWTKPDTTPEGTPVSRSEYTVLIVDDDASFLHLASTVLRKHGFNVLNASSGVKRLLKKLCFDEF